MLRYPVRRFVCVSACVLALGMAALAWLLWNLPNHHSYAHSSRTAMAAPTLAPLLYLIGCIIALRQAVSYPAFIGLGCVLNLYPLYLLASHHHWWLLGPLGGWALALLEAWEIQRRLAGGSRPIE